MNHRYIYIYIYIYRYIDRAEEAEPFPLPLRWICNVVKGLCPNVAYNIKRINIYSAQILQKTYGFLMISERINLFNIGDDPLHLLLHIIFLDSGKKELCKAIVTDIATIICLVFRNN